MCEDVLRRVDRITHRGEVRYAVHIRDGGTDDGCVPAVTDDQIDLGREAHYGCGDQRPYSVPVREEITDQRPADVAGGAGHEHEHLRLPPAVTR